MGKVSGKGALDGNNPALVCPRCRSSLAIPRCAGWWSGASTCSENSVDEEKTESDGPCKAFGNGESTSGQGQGPWQKSTVAMHMLRLAADVNPLTKTNSPNLVKSPQRPSINEKDPTSRTASSIPLTGH